MGSISLDGAYGGTLFFVLFYHCSCCCGLLRMIYLPHTKLTFPMLLGTLAEAMYVTCSLTYIVVKPVVCESVPLTTQM